MPIAALQLRRFAPNGLAVTKLYPLLPPRPEPEAIASAPENGVPEGSISKASQSSAYQPDIDTWNGNETDANTEFTGTRASLISEPGLRMAATSIGLNTFRPFWINVL